MPYSTLTCQSVNMEESWSFNFLTKNYVKNYTIELTITRSSLLFFPFKYDAVRIKQISGCSFGKKSCKILKTF